MRGSRLPIRLMRFGASTVVAAVLAAIVGAVITMAASPAQAAPAPASPTQAARTPAPTPKARQALSAILDGLDARLKLPPLVDGLLDNLLGGKADPTLSTPPGTSAPAPEPTTANSVLHPHMNAHTPRQPVERAHRQSQVAAVPVAQDVQNQAGGVDYRPSTHTKPKRTTNSSPVSAQAAPTVLRRALDPGSPAMLLAGVTTVCSLGIAGVVVLGGRRRGSHRNA